MAASLCPKRTDYALYRDRAAAAVRPAEEQ
jgi:hypothetical protein